MRRVKTWAVLALLTVMSLSACTDAEAGLFRRARQPVHSYGYAPTCYGGQCAAATATDDGPAVFLALLNAERARCGRGPLAWNASLASLASRNAGVHQPGTSGGGGQCWAGTSSYTHAFRMWMASPAHRNILMAARSSVGASTCPSGLTCNVY